MSIVYVGLDLGSSNFQQVALNHDGVSRVNRDFTTSECNLVKAFSDLKGEIHVHLEAGELAPWAASIITPLVTRVVCSHPKDNAWIAKDADKCDRIDAYKLAELLRLSRFSSKRKLWKYCRLSVSHRSSNGKPLRRPRLDRSGCGRLKDVSRKAFEVAVRSQKDNGFKRTYQRAFETTHDKTHARLTVQRKIVSTLRAIWLRRTPYCDELIR